MPPQQARSATWPRAHGSAPPESPRAVPAITAIPAANPSIPSIRLSIGQDDDPPASAGRRRRRAARSCRRPSNAQSTARSQPQCQLPTSEQPAWARAADRRGRPGCPRQGRAHRPTIGQSGRRWARWRRARTTTTSSSAAAADAHTASPPMRGTRLNEPSVRRARLQARARWTRS